MMSGIATKPDHWSRGTGPLAGPDHWSRATGPLAGKVILFGFLIVAFMRRLRDPDVWYHLVIGSEVVDRLAIPESHFYKYPLLGQPTSFHEWGFGVLAYVAESLSGVVGLSLLNAAIGAGTFFLLFLALRTGNRGPVSLLLWVLLLTYGWSEFRFVVRPETLLYLALAAEILILERFFVHWRFSEFAFLPALSFALSQCHPSSIILVIVFLAYGLNLFAGERARSLGLRRALLWWLGVSVAMVAAASINPYGTAQVLLPIEVLVSAEVYGNIGEFLPVLGTVYRYHFLSLAVVGLMATAVTARHRPGNVLLYVVFTYLAYRYTRNVALCAVVLAVPIAHGACILWGRGARTLVPRYIGPKFRTVAATLVAGYALLLFQWLPHAYAGWGVGLKEGHFPVASADFVRRVAPPGRILNFYHLGGYLAWALRGQYRVFIDGHNFRNNVALERHNAVFWTRPRWQHVLGDYDIGTIITPATLLYSGKLIPLVEVLAQHPDWELVVREKAALVFLRRDIAVESGARGLDKGMVWKQVIFEAGATAALYPEHPGAVLSLATAYERLGDVSRALENYKRYLELDPGAESVRQRIGRMTQPDE